MQTVKIGLIGCGTVTVKVHIPALMNDPSGAISNYNFLIKAICGFNNDNLNYIKSILPWVEVFNDYKDLLKNADCDAVLIATGEQLHPLISRDALNYGKFVLCEKPFGRNTEEIRKYFSNERCNSENKLQIAFNKRFYPVYTTYETLIKNGKFGKPICGNFQFLTQQGMKKGWDGILSNMIHFCDLIISIFGNISDLYCLSNENQKGINITASMKSTEGSIISFFFSSSALWNAPWHEQWFLLDNNRNRIFAHNCNKLIFSGNDNFSEYYDDSNSIFWLPDSHGYRTQLKSFYELVCGLREKPKVGIKDALAAHELFDKIRAICEKNK